MPRCRIRAGKSAMIRRRVSDDSDDQSVISEVVRPQPAHSLVAGSIEQILVQGVSIEPHRHDQALGRVTGMIAHVSIEPPSSNRTRDLRPDG